MKHIDTLRERTKRRIPRRFMGILLAAAVTASVMPVGGFAVSDSSERTAELCAHHSVHNAECGFSEENNAPCGYKCGVCPVEDLIAALPDTVTGDNADDVRAQLEEILALYGELNEDEQGQIDLSSVTELQGALDKTNAPMLTAEEINISQNRRNILTAEAGGCPGHTFTGKVQAAMIYVESGAHNVTFSNLNIFDAANVGIASGATMNLTINGTNTIHTDGNLAGIYVPVGATLVINGTGSLNVSGSGGGAGIGGAPYVPDEGGSDGDPNCGTVEINGGTVTATGGTSCGAGIGGGTTDDVPGNGGNVTINGGTVTATGGSDQDYYGGAGIGGAGGLYDPIFGEISSGCGGSLTINGGHVTLAPGQYNPQDNIAYGFGAGSGDVSGGTCELTLADASYLTVDSLDPNGKYTINGDPTEDMIVVPADLVYNGKAQELDGKIYIDDTKTGSGTYFNQTFTVKSSADGWVLQDLGEVVNAGEYTAVFKKGEKSISKTFTVAKSDTDLADGKVKTYNGETQTDSFTASDTITVKAEPSATGTTPRKAARLRGGYTEPTTGQMALFVGEVQVSDPVSADVDGIYTMTVSAADVLLAAGGPKTGITLTAKFIGNDNMEDAVGTVNVNISAVAKIEKSGAVTYTGNLDCAFKSDNSGATVTLLTDVDLGRNYISIYSDGATLDLNGKTVKSTAVETFYMSTDKFTIKDSKGGGKIENPSGNGAVYMNSGNLFIESGTISGFYGINASGGTVNISGGTIVGEETGLFVTDDGNAKISGGTFIGGSEYERFAISLTVYTSATLKSILADGCADCRTATNMTKPIIEPFLNNNSPLPRENQGAVFIASIIC